MEDRLPRKLSAILYADVADYSRLTALDEDDTHRSLTSSLDLFAEQVQAYRGRVGHYAGDAVLADFSNATDALACACYIQRIQNQKNVGLAEGRQLKFRVGINLGEVIDDRGEVFGDGVNIAARLEALAAPGGVCVSDAVRMAVGNRLKVRFEDLGDHEMKNIAAPVRVWQVYDSAWGPEEGESCVLRAEVRAFGILMGKSKRGIREALDSARTIITEEIEARGGVVLDIPSDTVMARFNDVRACVRCAVKVRHAVGQANALIAADERVHYRYGIDVGKLTVGKSGPVGLVVDHAAALCAAASPNEIRLSAAVCARLPDEVEFSLSAVTNDVYTIDRSNEDRAEPGSLPPQLASLDLPLPDKPSIALLPFEFVGDDPEGVALAEGLRIDIQNALVKLTGLFLIAAGAANALRGTAGAVAGPSLGVRYVLEGSVRRSGNRIRVNVQLTDTSDDVVIWSEQYDRNLGDEFALQDEITERVITALDVRLASGEQARIWRKCLTDPKARELFYRGISEFFQMSAESMAKARRNFERVAELAPNSPLGATWVAMSIWFQATRGWTDNAVQARQQAGEWAEKAIVFEDADGQAHTILGNVRLLQRRYDDALEIARTAVAVRPGCTNANGFLANVLLHCGEPVDAIAHIKNAIRISPVYPPWFLEILAASCREAGQIGDAISVAQEVVRLAPQNVQGRVILASSLVRAGWAAEAKRIGAEILALDETFSAGRYGEQQVFRDEAVIKRLVADLNEAGLPT